MTSERNIPTKSFRLPRSVQRTFLLLSSALFLTAAFLSIRAALADAAFQRNTEESLRKAVALAPGNAVYHALLGEHIEGLSGNPDDEFARAATLSPLDSQFLIRLGFRAETEGRYDQAEHDLLKAAAVDRKLNPKWSLANFYFRRGRTAEFWTWATRSLEAIRTDPVPVFNLMWELAPDSRAIEPHLPPAKNILQPWLFYLLDRHPGHLDVSESLLRKVAATAEAEDVPALVSWCDRMVLKQPSLALTMWNSLCDRRLIPFARLSPAAQIVTNGDFHALPSAQGFDWHTSASDGISLSLADEPEAGLSVRLSGTQPEDCILLWQPVPAKPGLHYQVTFRYRTSDPAALPGLSWESAPAPGADTGALAQSAPLVAGKDWQTGNLPLAAGPNGLAVLRLHYRRPLGSRRAEGTLVFRAIRAQAVQP